MAVGRKKKRTKKKIARIVKKKTAKRKVTRRKAQKKRLLKKRAISTKKIKKNIIGTVTHYFPKVRAAVIKLKTSLSLGDVVEIKGHTTDFTQNVASMQINHVPINSAKKGDEIGLLVDSRVRQNDIVYKP